MSAATKRKHVWQEVREDLVLPTPEQAIVKVLGGRGNNLHEVEDGTGAAYIVSMPTKFRKTVWVKRGGYVLVSPIAEGDKVKGEIVAVLYPDSVAHIAAQGLWPDRFADAVPSASNGQSQKTGENAAYGVDSDLLPPSDSESESADEEDANDGDESSDAGERVRRSQPRVYNPNHRRGLFARKDQGTTDSDDECSSREKKS